MSKKMTVKQAERRLLQHAKADLSEYQRTVAENSGLEANLKDLRRSFGLPMDITEYATYVDDRRNRGTRAELSRHIAGLVAAHHVEKWRAQVWEWALFGEPLVVGGSCGLPSVHGSFAADGSEVAEIIIPPDFDAGNPLYQSMLKKMRARFDPCPSPTPHGNEMDWRPVWEWGKRNPDVSRTEIALRLGYTRSYLTHKLDELDTL
jgi:hypothetical protein